MRDSIISKFPFPSCRQSFELVLVFILLHTWIGLTVAPVSASSTAQNIPPPSIRNVEIQTPQVAQYEKFQATFQVDTSATTLNLPFDAEPPQGIKPGTGITVDGLFSNDNWKTTIVQPAFLYQPVRTTILNRRNHLLPDGAPVWMVRFAPQSAGEWQFRLRAQDRGGTTTFPKQAAFKFIVRTGNGRYDGLRQNPSSRHGFLRVSENDARYFEFQDGSPFLGLGYNAEGNSLAQIAEYMRDWQVNGLQFARVWMSGAGLNGSQWTPWAFPKQPFTNGTPTVLLDTSESFGDASLSFRLDQEHPCMFADFWQGGIAVEPNTTYTVTLRAKLDNVQPRPKATDAGLTLMQAGWLDNGCDDLNAIPLVTPRLGTSDWYTVTGTLTTRANQNFLAYLYVALHNTQQGTAYIDLASLTTGDGANTVELLRRPRADSHLYFDGINAAKWDEIVDTAAAHGIYLKIVTDEKNEWIRNTLRANGTWGNFDNNNFYAAPNTAVRWVQEAWWRYLIARWGYSTAIHSFEFVNEGDPYNGNHYKAANAMAEYFQAHDPSQHMVTTSFWHSFPGREFWNNPNYSAPAYADLHAYISTGWGDYADFAPSANLETRPAYVRSGNGSFRVPGDKNINTQITPRGLTLNEPGEWLIRYWLKAENLQANCPRGSNGAQVRVRWVLDDGTQNGKAGGIVPWDSGGKGNVCGIPGGTYDWQQFSSDRDREGNPIPLEQRLVISDTLPHELTLFINNERGTGGSAWIDDIELISPSGVRVPVIGTFDATSFTQDPAWYTAAYSLLLGGASPVGAHKPLVRGEGGFDSAKTPGDVLDLNQDQKGIWLHNFVWGQINSGGMYDLLWWANKTIENNPDTGRNGALLFQFLPFARFMADVPLNNGLYRDANAVASDPRLRVWGQRDDTNKRAHLWIQNLDYQWQRVLAKEPVPPVQGTITLRDMPKGTCQIEWWDTNATTNPILLTQTVSSTGTLAFDLPNPLTSDIAVKLKCN